MIRRILPISPKEENCRMVSMSGMRTLKVDSIEPVPIGAIIVNVFRVVGYDQDGDGSLMARLEQIDMTGRITGWAPTHLGLYPDSTWVLDDACDLDTASDGKLPAPRGRNLSRS